MNPGNMRFIAMQRDSIRLTAALTLMDGYYAGARIIQGDSTLKLNRGVMPIKKSNALYAAVNLEPGEYAASVSAQYYFSANTSIQVALSPITYDPDQDIPTIPITLQPRPGYPFPPGATLIQGTAFSDWNGLPATEGVVRLLQDERIASRIDSFGRFVLALGDAWSGDEAIVYVFSRDCGEGSAAVRPRAGQSVFVNVALHNLS